LPPAAARAAAAHALLAREKPQKTEYQNHTTKQIPGVPIMYLSQHRYSIERLPEATIGGAPRT